jgi:2-dehydro-3-deoxygalactonokinase
MKTILCCDWGTTSFRLRLVDQDTYAVQAEFLSSTGVAATFREWKEQSEISRFEFYSGRLKSSILELAHKSGMNTDKIPVIVSGMASSSIGMEEIPYAELPFRINGSQASVRVFDDYNGSGAPLIIVSGVKSNVDVMRGEEAQLIGLVQLNQVKLEDNEEYVFVFPGTHSKHISVKGGLVPDFKTFMTGELFNIVSEHSILKDSVVLDNSIKLSDPAAKEAFVYGVENSANSSVLHTLFTVRTAQLFGKFEKKYNSFYLSGLLIGDELRQLQSASGQNLVICSGKHLYEHYKIASDTLNLSQNTVFIKSELIDKATIAGQIQLFKAFKN